MSENRGNYRNQPSNFRNNGHSSDIDPFAEMRSFNPFKLMSEFERIFEEDINYQNTHEGSFVNTGEDDDEFMKDFFGINHGIRGPGYNPSRFGRNDEEDFFHQRFDRPHFHRTPYNGENNHNNETPEAHPQKVSVIIKQSINSLF